MEAAIAIWIGLSSLTVENTLVRFEELGGDKTEIRTVHVQWEGMGWVRVEKLKTRDLASWHECRQLKGRGSQGHVQRLWGCEREERRSFEARKKYRRPSSSIHHPPSKPSSLPTSITQLSTPAYLGGGLNTRAAPTSRAFPRWSRGAAVVCFRAWYGSHRGTENPRFEPVVAEPEIRRMV